MSFFLLKTEKLRRVAELCPVCMGLNTTTEFFYSDELYFERSKIKD